MRRLLLASTLLVTGAATAVACGSKSATPTGPATASSAGAGGSGVGGSPGAGGSGGVAPDGGGGQAGGGGHGGGDAAAPYPAPHPATPKVLNQKGPVMTAPKVVAVTFQGDALEAGIDTFVGQVVADKAYWGGATAEYGVGPLKALPPQHLTEAAAPALADADVQTWLTGKVLAGGGFPQPDGETIYAIFYPASTIVTMGGGSLCTDFQGYHSDYLLSPGKHVSYAVMGRCPPPVVGVSLLDNLTAETSHELIEAATDPLPQDSPAWSVLDPDHLGWALVGGGGEVGDVCAAFPGVFYTPPGITNLVQRVWSNAAAAAGHDPCQPGGASPYFNAAPDLTDTLTVNSPQLGVFTTKGAHIPVGKSKTVALHLYSDAPTSGPWKLTVLDVASAFFGRPMALSFALDKTEGQNGDTIQLTITALAASDLGASPFWIESDLGTTSGVWIGLVGN